MTGGQVTVPLVIHTSQRRPRIRRSALAGSRELGLHRARSEDRCTSTPADVVGMMASAIRSDDPVMFFEHKGLLASKAGAPRRLSTSCVAGEAAVVRPGDDGTIVALASTVPTAPSAAEQLAGEDISIEVIDLRCLVPLDARTVLESVARTSRRAGRRRDPTRVAGAPRWPRSSPTRDSNHSTHRSGGWRRMRAAPVRRRTGGRSDSDRRQGRRRGATTRRFLREPKKPRQMQRSRADDNKDADPRERRS